MGRGTNGGTDNAVAGRLKEGAQPYNISVMEKVTSSK